MHTTQHTTSERATVCPSPARLRRRIKSGHKLTVLSDFRTQNSQAELIFENEHCPLTIEQVRGNLNSLAVKLQSVDASLTYQIMTRDATNITDEQMEEFKAPVKPF